MAALHHHHGGWRWCCHAHVMIHVVDVLGAVKGFFVVIRIAPWEKQITVRGIIASLLIETIYSVIAMKLGLRTGLWLAKNGRVSINEGIWSLVITIWVPNLKGLIEKEECERSQNTAIPVAIAWLRSIEREDVKVRWPVLKLCIKSEEIETINLIKPHLQVLQLHHLENQRQLSYDEFRRNEVFLKDSIPVWLAVAAKTDGVVEGLVGCGLIKSIVSISSGLMHDFKTGHLTFTSPRSMLLSQAIATGIDCVVAPLTFFLFYKAFEVGNPYGNFKALAN
ncbi:hypothetical protein AHAS_Ahas13G0054000 [Arachis hypogaea]